MSLNLDRSTWERVTLGDVARASKEKVDHASGEVERYIAGEHMDTDDLKIHRWGDVGDGYLGPAFHRRFHPGQVLYGSRRTYLRKVAVAEFGGVTANTTFVVETKDLSVLMQGFLPFVMSSEPFHAFAIQESKGSVNPYVNWSDIERYEFALPPLDEQSRLADLLWAVEHHRSSLVDLSARTADAASNLIANLRLCVLHTKQLNAVATVQTGQTFPKALQGRTSGEVPFFKVADLDRPGNERYLADPGNWVSESDVASLGAELFPTGTIVTARVGAAIRLERRRALAKPALVDENHLVIRPHSIDPDYLLAVLTETPLARNGNDGVVPSLNQQIVGAVTVPSLSRADEQRIGAAYRLLLDARESVTTELRTLVSFRAALLSEIFGGTE